MKPILQVCSLWFVFLSGCAVFQTEPPKTFQLQANWSRSSLSVRNYLGSRSGHVGGTALGNKTVIVGNAIDSLKAFDLEDGNEIWSRQIEAGVPTGVTILDGIVYAGGGDGSMYALNIKDGSLTWKYPSRAEIIAPATLDDKVLYFQNAQGFVYALDKKNGDKIWMFTRPLGAGSSIRGGPSPVMTKNLVIVGFPDGQLVALNKIDGSVKWERNLLIKRRFSDIQGLVVHEEKLIATVFDGPIHVFDAQTGSDYWQKDWSIDSNVTIVGGVGYLSTSDSQIKAFKLGDGEVIWSYDQVRGHGTKPVVEAGILFVGETEQGLLALDASTGRFLARFTPARGVMATPSVDKDKNLVFFHTIDSVVWSLKWLRGNPLEKFEFQRPIIH
ncbi:MAG: hypothetical protein COT74_11760 [Bdellovibrionales bacterium CG10_big_fil_rev_8_21_14_0_10_45_34]|nr:MAG: hypothetical protein COT74_11760 [Bdellovibrionales bacterium CG10_big_fil_rev_8_21_14_0_10_45_34]